MLHLRAPNPAERANTGMLQNSWKGIQKNEFGVTAMLSYEQQGWSSTLSRTFPKGEKVRQGVTHKCGNP
jgi:hypothetical protein